MNKRDLTNQSFGRWVVVGESSLKGNRGQVKWDCVCSCGNKGSVLGNNLTRGISTSCGCYISEVTSKRNHKHGLAHSYIWNVWQMMIRRCYDPDSVAYKNYGGRGISVCERWLNSVENFYLDMGERPSSKYSLERIDNNGNYEPSNCKWATTKEQSRNRRNNRVLNCNGIKKCVADFAEEIGVHPDKIHNRLKYGWSDYEAVYGKKTV